MEKKKSMYEQNGFTSPTEPLLENIAIRIETEIYDQVVSIFPLIICCLAIGGGGDDDTSTTDALDATKPSLAPLVTASYSECPLPMGKSD